MNVVLYSDDILLIEHWEKSLNKECSLVYDLDELFQVQNSVIIINYTACEDGNSAILDKLTENNRVLLLHRIPNIVVAKQVLSNGVKGYGNAMMKPHFILSAVDALKDGMIWLHPEFTSLLIKELPQNESSNNESALDILSSREKEVALLLKNAKTYNEIAQKLDITPRTVKAHAQSAYKKLGVKDRLGLALYLK